MASQGGGGGGGPVWEEVPRYITRTKRLRMSRGDFISAYGLGRNRTAAGAAALAAAGLGRYRLKRRTRRTVRRRYRGKGGFWSDLWGKTAGIRNRLGDMARSSTNPYLQLAGQASRMLGTGAYEGEDGAAVSNEIVDGGTGMHVPVFNATPSGEMGAITISHREFVADVYAPTSAGYFNNITYGLNPALPQTFPWLSQLAANYDEYTIKQLIFTFRSTITDFVASNGQVGTLIMATQYNANDTPFASKQDMMEYSGAVSAKCSQTVVAGVECDPAQLSGPPGKYTRSGPTPPGEDTKTYDLGTFNIATANTPTVFNNQAIGELWVSYTVELRKPKFFVSRAQSLLTDLFMAQGPSPSISECPWASGQQNRIGGYVSRSLPTFPWIPGPGANVLYYTFPPTFSGNVEVLIQLDESINAGPNTTGIKVGPQAPSPGTTLPPGIVPINDLWDNNNWTYEQISQGTATTYAKSTYRAHFKVTSPTTAQTTIVDNILRIEATATPGIPIIAPSYTVNSWTITVSMYNTGLNYDRVDRPLLANPNTLQLIDFPQGAGFVL